MELGRSSEKVDSGYEIAIDFFGFAENDFEGDVAPFFLFGFDNIQLLEMPHSYNFDLMKGA